MKKTVLLTCLAALAVTATAYEVSYTCDADGNRIMREPKTEVINRAVRSLPDKVATESMIGEVRVLYSPNPTEGMLHVTVNTDKDNVGALQIYSSSGSLISQFTNTSSADFDLSGQQPGIYLLLVEANGENHVCKIIRK